MSRFVALLLTLSAVSVAHAGGDDLYVSTLGDDTSNDCRTITAPCRTIGHGIASAADEDSVLVAAGTYEEAVVVSNPPEVAVVAGYDETFATRQDGVTFWQSKNTRPLTFLADGDTDASITVHGVTFARSSQKPDLTVQSDYGGAILLRAINSSQVGLFLRNVVMSGNKAAVGGAIAVLSESGSSATIDVTQSTFTRNKAEACGAIYVDSIDAPPANVNVSNSSFEKNKGTFQGGAMCLIVTDETNTETTQRLSRNVFTKNRGITGGAVLALVVDGGHLDLGVYNSVFVKNKSQLGGAIAAIAVPGEAAVPAGIDLVTIHNTINANKASIYGAGTFVASSRQDGDGSDDSTVVHDSTNDIYFGNKGAAEATLFEDLGTSATMNRQYGIFGTVELVFGTLNDGDGVQVAADPLFVKSGQDVNLQSGSPAIDAGTCVTESLFDVEGDSRPNGPTCDIGAIEF